MPLDDEPFRGPDAKPTRQPRKEHRSAKVRGWDTTRAPDAEDGKQPTQEPAARARPRTQGSTTTPGKAKQPATRRSGRGARTQASQQEPAASAEQPQPTGITGTATPETTTRTTSRSDADAATWPRTAGSPDLGHATQPDASNPSRASSAAEPPAIEGEAAATDAACTSSAPAASAPSDWKRERRTSDRELMKRLHAATSKECAVCGTSAVRLSLHHVYPRGQGGDDVTANLAFLCGSGTTGCHGLVENEDKAACRRLGRWIREHRPDTVLYLASKLGSSRAADDWLRRRLYAPRVKGTKQ